MARYGGEGILGHDLAEKLHIIVTQAVAQQIQKGGDMSHLCLDRVPLDAFDMRSEELEETAQDLAHYLCLSNCVIKEVDGRRCLSADITERGMSWSEEYC